MGMDPGDERLPPIVAALIDEGFARWDALDRLVLI
jgi:hypothetical protein